MATFMDGTRWMKEEKRKKEVFLKSKINTDEITDDLGTVTGRIISEKFLCPPGEPYKSRGEILTEVVVTITVDFTSFSYVGGRNYLKLEARIDDFDCYSKTGDPKQLEKFICLPNFKEVVKWKNTYGITMKDWISGLIEHTRLLIPTEEERNGGKTRKQLKFEEHQKFQEEMRSSRYKRN